MGKQQLAPKQKRKPPVYRDRADVRARAGYVTAGDLELASGLPQSWWYAAAARGTVPSFRLGDRYLRFPKDEVMAWIAAQRQP